MSALIPDSKFLDLTFGLLRYYGHGNFSGFSKIVDMACSEFKVSIKKYPFLRWNLFVALELAGVIEVLETMSSTRWALVSDIPYAITKKSPLILGTEAERSSILDKLPKGSGELVPLVSSPEVTIRALRVSNQAVLSSLQEKVIVSLPAIRITDFWPSLRTVLDRTVEEDTWRRHLEDRKVEKYDFSKGKWLPDVPMPRTESGFYRIPKFGNERELRIIFPKEDLSYKVLYPEWGHLIAAGMLKHLPLIEYNKSNGKVTFGRSFRVPRLLLKALAFEADNIEVRETLCFSGIGVSTINWLEKYLGSLGGLGEKRN